MKGREMQKEMQKKQNSKPNKIKQAIIAAMHLVKNKQKIQVAQLFTAAVLVLAMTMGLVGCAQADAGSGNEDASEATPAANTDPIVIVWYPNESANVYKEARDEIGRLIEQATGRPVEQKLTTDYVITIEAIASGSADIAWAMGAVGYIEAQRKNPEVSVLFVNSGPSGTLDDAIYYSWLAVPAEEAGQYREGSGYSIENIKGQTISFVSNSSTSGFKVPSGDIINHFPQDELEPEDLLEGGSNAFFSEVLFGGSHQGSAFNMLTGNADVAAFCDTEMHPYAELKTGTENEVGAIYTIKPSATAPFDTVIGRDFTIINSTPVLNGPNVFNPANLSEAEIKAIRDLFTSDEVYNNGLVFFDDSIEGAVGLHKKTASGGYVLVNDSWYDPIRKVM